MCVCGGGGGGGGMKFSSFLQKGTEILVAFVGAGGGTVHFYQSQSNSRSPLVVKNYTSLMSHIFNFMRDGVIA